MYTECSCMFLIDENFWQISRFFFRAGRWIRDAKGVWCILLRYVRLHRSKSRYCTWQTDIVIYTISKVTCLLQWLNSINSILIKTISTPSFILIFHICQSKWVKKKSRTNKEVIIFWKIKWSDRWFYPDFFFGSRCNWHGNSKEANNRKGGEPDKEINDTTLLVSGHVCITT